MGISNKFSRNVEQFNDRDTDRIIRMAWEDRTPFEVIRMQFGLSPNQTVKFMRAKLRPAAYKSWRKRANQRGALKQGKKREKGILRFKSRMQRLDGSTKSSQK